MKQPEALRLADALDNGEVYESHSKPVYGWCGNDPCGEAAAELRRLHALNAELVEALESIANYPELDALEMKREARAAISKAKEQ